MAEEAMWYVAHTYSGYENKVKANIEKSVENRGISDLIQAVEVPMEDVIEEKNGDQKVVKRKIFPGYVLVKMGVFYDTKSGEMKMTDEAWYVVRNTRGVTGFVGPESKPRPLSEKEVIAMGVEKHTVEVSYEVGDLVSVIGGPFDSFQGTVDMIDIDNDVVRVIISMMGRETPIELGLDQVEPALD